MASSSTSNDYPFPCYVNAASFMSTKLSGKSNYVAWKAQMICLVDTHDMHGFIDGTKNKPPQNCWEWERSDNLVKGWIFGSLSEGVMAKVAGLQTAFKVWNTLKERYSPKETERTENFDQYSPLYRALYTAEQNIDVNLLEQMKEKTALNNYRHSSLHVAIGNPKNTEGAIPWLLEKIQGLGDLKDKFDQNPLHYAAVLGNTEAARLLVEQNEDLLSSVAEDTFFPIHKAVMNSHKKTVKYLFDECISRDVKEPFEGERGALLLCELIMAGFLDIAYDLLQRPRHRDLAKTVFPGRVPPLCCIADKPNAFRSAKQYNFYQRFIYSHMAIDNDLPEGNQTTDTVNQETNMATDNDLPEGNQTTDIVNQETNMATGNSLPEGNQTVDTLNHEINMVTDNGLPEGNQTADTVNQETNMEIGNGFPEGNQTAHTENQESMFDKIIGILGKVSPLHLPHVKRLKKDKVDHNKALMILELICETVGNDLESGHRNHYEDAYFTAVKNDIPEVVKEITTKFPQSILMSNPDGLTLPQISIIHRCEKIYNFFVHEVIHNMYLHIIRTDNEGNNLLHLAGQLAPTHKLNMVTGAALQMQRELQWFEEVKTLMRPREREEINKNEETPMMVFRKAHADLRKEGEVWIKKVVDSYTITATLIITIVFAAAITVPGGIKENGKPTFKIRPAFIVFLVSDAISLFTSTISLLFFLSILTARYADEDFLSILPTKLMCGLVMLFMSVTTMLISFGATLHIMFGQENLRTLIIIATITCVPITLFVALQFPLFIDLISSTYGRGIFRKRSELRA